MLEEEKEGQRISCFDIWGRGDMMIRSQRLFMLFCILNTSLAKVDTIDDSQPNKYDEDSFIKDALD